MCIAHHQHPPIRVRCHLLTALCARCQAGRLQAAGQLQAAEQLYMEVAERDLSRTDECLYNVAVRLQT